MNVEYTSPPAGPGALRPLNAPSGWLPEAKNELCSTALRRRLARWVVLILVSVGLPFFRTLAVLCRLLHSAGFSFGCCDEAKAPFGKGNGKCGPTEARLARVVELRTSVDGDGSGGSDGGLGKGQQRYG